MAMTKTYYAANGRMLGEKAAGGQRVDYLTDALGSVTATANQSAAVVNTYRYKPYGQLLQKTGAGADPAFGWVGSQGYRQTGKKYSDVYVRARHYDTQTERWTAKDPLWPKEPAYLAVHANPTVLTDPSGMQAGGLMGMLGCLPCDQFPGGPCEWARFHGYNGDDYGGIVCCKGQKTLCVWLVPSPKNPGDDCIARCVAVHEQSHMRRECCYGNNPRTVTCTHLDEDADECLAYHAGISCFLKTGRVCCLSKPPMQALACIAQLDQQMCNSDCDRGQKRCRKAGWPVIHPACFSCPGFKP